MLVVMEASDQQLTTVETAYQDGGVEAALDQDTVARLIAAASSACARHCNRVFGRERVREAFRPGRGPLLLARKPVVEIHSIVADGETVLAAGYELDAEVGLLERLDAAGDPCPWWHRRVVVEYTAGWLLPSSGQSNLPAEIEQACLLMIADAVASQGRDPRLRSESSEGVGATSWLDPRPGAEQLPPQAAGLLAGYRRIAI